MKLLSGLLARYQHIQAPQKALREAFISAVYQETGIEIKEEDVQVQGKTVRLNVPSVVKSEIHLNQQPILKRVSTDVGEKSALTAIF